MYITIHIGTSISGERNSLYNESVNLQISKGRFDTFIAELNGGELPTKREWSSQGEKTTSSINERYETFPPDEE